MLSGGESALPPCFLLNPDDLGGEGEPRPLLARGDGDRLFLPVGLMEVSG